MAEQQTPVKRQRDETQSSQGSEEHVVEESKRHKSYNHILSLLEAEEDEPNQDLSSLITTLQQELSSDSVLDDPLPCPTATTLGADRENQLTRAAGTNTTTTTTTTTLEDYTSATSSLKEDEDQDDKERVIRHLLEASDDELGIPNREGGDGLGVEVVEYEERFNNVGNGFAFSDGLWELEDEAANYYTLLQSELFM
ncbi:hypothetical protein QUC31_013509 [Theobroma cacao]|uniref:Uncharacterized protein n=1 Tax=Theobroma cacao TaxID=3641 RepID=A0A061EC30_THECC|nr:Uncharacterized protein TCM_011746 [Theobroma cacao]